MVVVVVVVVVLMCDGGDLVVVVVVVFRYDWVYVVVVMVWFGWGSWIFLGSELGLERFVDRSFLRGRLVLLR